MIVYDYDTITWYRKLTVQLGIEKFLTELPNYSCANSPNDLDDMPNFEIIEIKQNENITITSSDSHSLCNLLLS